MNANSDNIYASILIDEYIETIESCFLNRSNRAVDDSINSFNEMLFASFCISIVHLISRFNFFEIDENKYRKIKKASIYFGLDYTLDIQENIKTIEPSDRETLLMALQDIFLLFREYKDAMQYIQEFAINYDIYQINSDDPFYKNCINRAFQEEEYFKGDYFNPTNAAKEDVHLLKIESATDFLLFDRELWTSYLPGINENVLPELTDMLNYVVYFGIREKMISRAIHFITYNDKIIHENYPDLNSPLTAHKEAGLWSSAFENQTKVMPDVSDHSLKLARDITKNDLYDASAKWIAINKIKKEHDEGEE